MATKKTEPGKGLKRAVKTAKGAPGRHIRTTRKGSLNEVTLRTREYILASANPVDFLITVMRGEPFPQPEALRDPETGQLPIVFPEADQRIEAAKLLLPRVMPTLKPIGGQVVLNIGAINKPEDILVAINAVMDAVTRGELPPEDATPLIAIIDKAREAIATDDLAKELEELKSVVGDLTAD